MGAYGAGMDQISGLPAHPLVVHLPVAMLPLAAFGVVLMLIRRSWYERYRWAVLFIGAVGTVGAFIATSSGEALQKRIGEIEGPGAAEAIEDHARNGDLARTLAIVFFIALALYVLVPWFLERRSTGTATIVDDGGRNVIADGTSAVVVRRDAGPVWVRPVLMVLVAVAAVASVASVIDAGHSGASSAWNGYYGDEVDGG